MTKEGHAACLFFLIILIIGNISLAIENNESRIFSISKKEFLNVLQGIIFSSNFENINESTTLNKNENTGNIDSKTVKKPKVIQIKANFDNKINSKNMMNKIERRKLHRRYNNNYHDDEDEEDEEEDLFNGKNVRKDSFFFLQRNLELRKEEHLFEKNYNKNNNKKNKFNEEYDKSENKVNIDDNDKYYYDSNNN